MKSREGARCSQIQRSPYATLDIEVQVPGPITRCGYPRYPRLEKPVKRVVTSRPTKVVLLSLLFAAGMLIGCTSNRSASNQKVVTENRSSIQISDLPAQFLNAVDTSSEGAINDKLSSQDSLTLDGTTLIVGPVGGNRTVMLTANSLKLINGARIVTNGNQLSIVALNMESNNSGGIDSFFQETAKAAPGTQGADGGRVEIYVTKSVVGSLRVSLAGQIGGDGTAGAPGPGGAAGDRGSDASDKALGCGSSGGNGGTGKPGGKGYPGSPGASGGNGGDLVLEGKTVANHESHFPYQAQPGLGGTGGAGGPGGAGGAGGQAGSGSHFCGTGVAGNGGQQGSPGDAGPNGASGGAAGKIQLK
jgi:hypothetical protein